MASCSSCLRYTDFSKVINEDIEKTNIPISGAIEITANCNMRCRHCYMPQRYSNNELSVEEIKNIIDQITEAGCLWLLVTGGEPLVRRDFIEIYDYIKSKGILITLFTNGTLISEEIADHFKENPPFSIEISLYGATRDIHDSVTRADGSFNKCIDGIERLVKRKLPLKLKTMAIKTNYHQIKDMQQMAKKWDVPFRFDPLINPTIEGTDDPLDERLSPKEVIQLEKNDNERASEWTKLFDKYYGYIKSDYIYTCGAGRNYFHIDAYGKLNMCVLLRIPGYDLRSGSFEEGYALFQEIRETQKPIPNRCSNCKINIMCGLCPGWGLLENKDVSQPVNYLCEVAHLRASQFGGSYRKEVNL